MPFFTKMQEPVTQTTPTLRPAGSHIAWIDLLRVVACLMVVISHSADFFVGQLDNNYSEFLQGSFWGSLVRACVPLFVMISGVLLLPVKQDTATFYKKRLGRVVWPLVCWSIVLPLAFWAYGAATADEAGRHLLMWPLNFTDTTVPLWYLYMLVGLYLFLPIISPWLQQASRKDIRRFLMIWGFTLLLPPGQLALKMAGGNAGDYGELGLFGVCAWNPFGTFYYFAGFLGYVVLAHYRMRFPLQWSRGKTLGVAAVLFVGGFALTEAGFLWIQNQHPGGYDAAMELPWSFTGLNVFMMTYAVFIVMQKVEVRGERCRKFLNRTAALTFGIYLCHFFFVRVGYDLVYEWLPVPAWLQIPAIAVLAFGVSAGVVRLLQLIPGSKYIVG